MDNNAEVKERKEEVSILLPFIMFFFCLFFALLGQVYFFILGTIPMIAIVIDMLSPKNIKRLIIPKVLFSFIFQIASIAFFIHFYLGN